MTTAYPLNSLLPGAPLLRPLAAALVIFGVLCGAYAPQLLAQREAEIKLGREYYFDGDYERALEIWENALKADRSDHDLAQEMLQAWLLLGDTREAQDLVEKQLKLHPEHLPYHAAQLWVAAEALDTARLQSLVQLLYEQLQQPNDYYTAGHYLMRQDRHELALRIFHRARKQYGDPRLFADPLYKIHLDLDQPGEATRELIAFYFQQPDLLETVRSEILRLAPPGGQAAVEQALLQAVQETPKNPGLREIIYDYYLQIGDFQEAFLQARSMDRLFNERGRRLFKLAKTLQNNKRYALSNKVLDFIIEKVETTPHYVESFSQKAQNFELQAFEAKPLDSASLRQAVAQYDALFERFGRDPNLAEAMYRKARLCIFYLNDLETGMAELTAIEQLNAPPQAKAEAQLLAGDVLLLQGQYNKAKLKYGDVEEQFHEGQTGANAKFRLARLDYYDGQFAAARSRLKILKDNSTNDIANDAIRLFLLIQDNTGLDTSETALQLFANAQRLIYQRRFSRAVNLLDSLAFTFPDHPLNDEILWEKVQIHLAKGELAQAETKLLKLLETAPEDVLADDALFQLAELYQYNLNRPKKAQELYLQMLTDYPDSVLNMQARERIRELRKAG